MPENSLTTQAKQIMNSAAGGPKVHFPHMEAGAYLDRYKLSINDRLSYWSARADEYLDWIVPFKNVEAFDEHQSQWFVGGELNASYNCLDRHLETKGDDIAIIWCAEEQGVDRKISYKQLHAEVVLMSNALHAMGLKQADRVCLYATMLPEIVVSMLACARLGLIYEFINLERDLADIEVQIQSVQPKLIITADQGSRSGNHYPLFLQAQHFCAGCDSIENVVVVRSQGKEITLQEGRDHWYHAITTAPHPEAPIASVAATSPLFMSYQHNHGVHLGYISAGYLLYCAITYRRVFDYQDGDVLWCAANFNEVKGHASAVWGSLVNGSTTVIYDGDANRLPIDQFWQIVEQYQVNILYAREDGLEKMIAQDVQAIERESWRSLRVVGLAYSENNQSVIEACQQLSFDHCVIITTTNLHNTGQILFAHTASPEAGHGIGDPFFGIVPVIVDDQGEVVESGPTQGALQLQHSWPSQNRVYSDFSANESIPVSPLQLSSLVGQWNQAGEGIGTGLFASRDEHDNYYLLTS